AGPPTTGWEESAQIPTQTYPELIPDAAKVEADWFRRTGIYPIHGTIVVKTDVLARHPVIGRALYDAFVEAKKPHLERLARGERHAPEDERYRALSPRVGAPLPSGMRGNRASIEALITCALQQELIP